MRKWLRSSVNGKESLKFPSPPKIVFWEGRQGIGAETLPGAKTLQRRESLTVKVKKKLANARRKKREQDDTPQQPSNTLNDTEETEEESKESIALKSRKRKLERPIFEKTTPKRKRRKRLTNDHNKPPNISLNGLRDTDSERHIDTRDLIVTTNGGQGGKVLNGDSLQTSSKVRQNTTA